MTDCGTCRWLAVVLLGALVVGCASGEKGGKSDTDPYLDWQTYSFQQVKIIYPLNFALVDSLEDIAKQYVAAIERNCRFFEIPVPEDTLVVYYYPGYNTGREITGRRFPFADSTGVHFWMPSFPGVTLMQWLLPYWVPIEPRHQFLKHGLIVLLDYSGQNCHYQTIYHLERDEFVPLAELAVDTTIDSDTERRQSAFAASFVDFISFYYGIKALEVLYRAQTPFEDAVEGIFMMPVDSLQRRWLDFARSRAAEWKAANPDRLPPDDTLSN